MVGPYVVVIYRSSGTGYAQAFTKNAGLGWKQIQ